MRTIAAIILAFASALALAQACRTYTVEVPGGRWLTCTECCTGSVCSVSCW